MVKSSRSIWLDLTSPWIHTCAWYESVSRKAELRGKGPCDYGWPRLLCQWMSVKGSEWRTSTHPSVFLEWDTKWPVISTALAPYLSQHDGLYPKLLAKINTSYPSISCPKINTMANNKRSQGSQTMEAHCFLACLLWLAYLPFSCIPGSPAGDDTTSHFSHEARKFPPDTAAGSQ